MTITRFDEVLDGMNGNADDKTIDLFLSVANKVAKLLKTKLNDLYIIIDSEYVDTSDLNAVSYNKAKLYSANNYVVEQVNGNSWIYFKSESDAQKYIDEREDSQTELLTGYKEKEVHDYLSARRLADKYDGRITGPITNDNGVKIFKVIYRESLSEAYDDDYCWWDEDEHNSEVSEKYKYIYEDDKPEIINFAINKAFDKGTLFDIISELPQEDIKAAIAEYLNENNTTLANLSKKELHRLIYDLDIDEAVYDYVAAMFDDDWDFCEDYVTRYVHRTSY